MFWCKGNAGLIKHIRRVALLKELAPKAIFLEVKRKQTLPEFI